MKKKVPKPNFIKALTSLKKKLKDDKYAQKVYAALCNVVWVHQSKPQNYKEEQEKNMRDPSTPEPLWQWACSWRGAGGLVADVRNKGEDYLNFYCSGNEEEIDEEVADDLKVLGWEPDLDYYSRLKVIQDHDSLNEIGY